MESPSPRRIGWIFVGLYCLALLLLLVYMLRPNAGDMSGIMILYATLPWSYLGNVGVVLGLGLNGAVAYWLGYGLGVIRRRWCLSSSDAPSRR